MATSKKSKSGVGVAIRALRKTAGLTLHQAKDLAGADAAYISRVENGLAAPSPAWVENMIDAIGRHIQDAA